MTAAAAGSGSFRIIIISLRLRIGRAGKSFCLIMCAQNNDVFSRNSQSRKISRPDGVDNDSHIS